MERIVEEEFGEELSLERTPQTLTLVGELEEGEDSTFDVILNMVKDGPGQWSACYLIAVMTLMIARVPSQTMIARLTNDFNESEEQVQENINNFIELRA